MSGLVTLGTGPNEQTAHRRTADYDTLTRPPGAKAFVDGFIEARLFVADQDTAGRAIVSVAHEALLARQAPTARQDGASASVAGDPVRPWLWARRGEWVEANADLLRLRARVAAGLKQWQDAGQDAGFLLPAGRLPGRPGARGRAVAGGGEHPDYLATLPALETRVAPGSWSDWPRSAVGWVRR